MSEKKQRGGKRIPGEGKSLGRPKELVNAKVVTVRLEADQLDWIKSQGNITDVIRGLVIAAMQKEK